MRGVIIGLSDDLISNYFELNYNFIIVAASPAKEGTFFDRKDGCLLLRLLRARYSIEYFQKSTTWLERRRVPWSIGYYIFF